jgi:hypothetical protein
MPGLVPCLGNGRIAIRKAAVQALQVGCYLLQFQPLYSFCVRTFSDYGSDFKAND